MNIIDTIMNTKSIKDNPPILLDIGASDKIHYKWEKIAKYSICIAFDPDSRDIEKVKNNKSFKKLYFIDKLVSFTNNEKENFYLTIFPQCSSMLKPLQEEVDKYSYGYLFNIEKIRKTCVITLEEILNKLNITKVDWIKTDSQGIDLKLFKSLPQWNQVITAEFEPGFINAYYNEDKVSNILFFMDKQNFWLSEFLVEGDVRIHRSIKDKYFKNHKNKRLISMMKTNPGWAGMTYMNDYSKLTEKRDYLLGIAFNYIEGNLAYCFELCDTALHKFQDNIFNKILSLLLIEKKKLEKEVDVKINSLEFNKNLFVILNKLEELNNSNKKFILYGAGTGAELIMKFIPNVIEFIVDINYESIKNKFPNTPIYSLDKLKMEKRQIIISVFGRESTIKDLLINTYMIEESQIISIC